ncbi:guanine permease [Deltaproteobacteria bacterium Smac51]|nr:guanine permease [Deltaproteobacteria bacterium Smac51]
MEEYFKLKDKKTTVSREVLCGITTFLTMSYILFVNPAIVSESGMPAGGIFVATALAAAFCTILMGLVANTPFAMAPGMGLNTFTTYIICGAMGFHWREAMGLAFIAGLCHFLIMITGSRRILVNAIPTHLKMAFGVGLGLFISYIGLKNAGLLSFTSPPGQHIILDGGTIIANSGTVPAMVGFIGAPQVLALTGLVIMVALLALERKTGDSYAALPVGIVAATFLGVPLGVTDLGGIKFIDLSAVGEISGVFMSFFGRPGLLSILDDPSKIMISIVLVLTLLLTNIMDSVGTIIGIGRIQKAEIFNRRDMELFREPGRKSRLDKSMMVNSIGGGVSALLGTTTSTTFIESITGIVSGGRTGLTAVVAGVMFLICLPLANFFSIVPATAIAPALIVAGSFMITLAGRINWKRFEESFPAFVTILGIPIFYGIIYGMAGGIISHIIIQAALGKWRKVHPALYFIAFLFILIAAARILEG